MRRWSILKFMLDYLTLKAFATVFHVAHRFGKSFLVSWQSVLSGIFLTTFFYTCQLHFYFTVFSLCSAIIHHVPSSFHFVSVWVWQKSTWAFYLMINFHGRIIRFNYKLLLLLFVHRRENLLRAIVCRGKIAHRPYQMGFDTSSGKHCKAKKNNNVSTLQVRTWSSANIYVNPEKRKVIIDFSRLCFTQKQFWPS